MVVHQLKALGPGLSNIPPDDSTPEESLAPGSDIPDERCFLTTSNSLKTSGEISVGTWAASKHTCKMSPYPISEFCYILEGKVYITTEDGKLEVFGPGDAFYIEEGTMLEWKQLGIVRKYFVIHENSEEEDQPTQHPHKASYYPISKL